MLVSRSRRKKMGLGLGDKTMESCHGASSVVFS